VDCPKLIENEIKLIKEEKEVLKLRQVFFSKNINKK